MGREIGVVDGGRTVEELDELFPEGAVFARVLELLVGGYVIPV